MVLHGGEVVVGQLTADGGEQGRESGGLASTGVLVDQDSELSQVDQQLSEHLDGPVEHCGGIFCR